MKPMSKICSRVLWSHSKTINTNNNNTPLIGIAGFEKKLAENIFPIYSKAIVSVSALKNTQASTTIKKVNKIRSNWGKVGKSLSVKNGVSFLKKTNTKTTNKP